MSVESFKIFVVEDNEWYNKLIVHNLSLNPDYSIKSFVTGKDLLGALSEEPDVITLDYRLPDMIGEDLLDRIKRESPSTEVIVISEQDDIETAVNLLKIGAFDYLVKSKDIRDRLLNAVQHIRNQSGLKQRVRQLEKEVVGKYSFQKMLLGESAPMQKVFSLMEKAVMTNINVMISGETGTGKEVVAKAIHYNSDRKKKPFIAVNMAAIPADLIESELFGHEKGAFTGASSRRKGKFEEATGGTIFLDEIGEMDISFQAKLLRVLQEMEVTRVGSNQPVKLDCRIISATNLDLREQVKMGNFREDLFYRLMGLPVELPPLRDRSHDMLILAKRFIDDFVQSNNLPEKRLSEEAKSKVLSAQWPGNVRELKSVIELATVLSSGDTIESVDITLNDQDALPDLMTKELTLREYNIRIVKQFLDRYDNDTKKVADKLGIGQTTVYRMLKEDKVS